MGTRWSQIIGMILIVAVVCGYGVYYRESERVLPRDFNLVAKKIDVLKAKKEQYESVDDLETLSHSWTEMKTAAQLFNVNARFKEERRKSRDYKGKTPYWKVELSGRLQDVLSVLKLVGSTVPFYLNEIKGKEGEVNLDIIIVGVE